MQSSVSDHRVLEIVHLMYLRKQCEVGGGAALHRGSIRTSHRVQFPCLLEPFLEVVLINEISQMQLAAKYGK